MTLPDSAGAEVSRVLDPANIYTKEDLLDANDHILSLDYREACMFVLTVLSNVLPSKISVPKSEASQIRPSGHKLSFSKNTAASCGAVPNSGLAPLLPPSKAAPLPPPSKADEKERRRSVVLAHLPECSVPGKTAQQRCDFDFDQVGSILDKLGMPYKPISVYRMGKNLLNGVPRLLKVVLPSSTIQHVMLTQSKLLRESKRFSKVFIRRSLTLEQRQTSFVLREQLRALQKNSPHHRFRLNDEYGTLYNVNTDAYIDINEARLYQLQQTWGKKGANFQTQVTNTPRHSHRSGRTFYQGSVSKVNHFTVPNAHSPASKAPSVVSLLQSPLSYVSLCATQSSSCASIAPMHTKN